MVAVKKKKNNQITVEESRAAQGLPQNPAPRQRTPQEVAQAQAEGNDYIKQREKLAAQSGISSKAAGSILNTQAEAPLIKQRAIEEETARLQSEQARALAGQPSFSEITQTPQIIPLNAPGTTSLQQAETPSVQGLNIPQGADLQGASFSQNPQTAFGVPITLEAVNFEQQAVINAAKITGHQGADFYVAIRNLLSTKKTVQVSKAEQSFSDAKSIIQTNIDLVALGKADPFKVNADLQRAKNAVSALETENQGVNTVNLRYLLDNGAELQAQIDLEKSDLENLQVQLDQARQQAIINKAAQNLGYG